MSFAFVCFYATIFREEFHSITLSLGKIHRDGRQMVKGGSVRLTEKQLLLRIGIKPTLAYCLDGLMTLHDMYQSEYETITQLEVLQHFNLFVITFFIFGVCYCIFLVNCTTR